MIPEVCSYSTEDFGIEFRQSSIRFGERPAENVWKLIDGTKIFQLPISKFQTLHP